MRLLLRQQRIKSWQMRAVSLRHQTESHGSGEHTKQNQIDPATCFFKYCAAQAAAPRRRLSLRSGRPSAPSPPKEPCKLYKIATQVPLHTSCSPSSLRRNVETQGGASRHRGSPCGFWRCSWDQGARRRTTTPTSPWTLLTRDTRHCEQEIRTRTAKCNLAAGAPKFQLEFPHAKGRSSIMTCWQRS